MTFLVTSLVGHAELLFQIDIHRCFFWFGVQSRRFISAFRGIVVSFWRSEPLIISQLDVQSHHVFSSITLGVIFLSLTLIVISFSLVFKAVFCFCLAFRSTSSFDVQSHAMFHLAYRATVHSRFTTFGVTMPHFQFGVQSHHFSFLAFRAIIASSFGIQSHHFSISVFRAILVAFSISAFKAIIIAS